MFEFCWNQLQNTSRTGNTTRIAADSYPRLVWQIGVVDRSSGFIPFGFERKKCHEEWLVLWHILSAFCDVYRFRRRVCWNWPSAGWTNPCFNLRALFRTSLSFVPPLPSSLYSPTPFPRMRWEELYFDFCASYGPKSPLDYFSFPSLILPVPPSKHPNLHLNCVF